jgi:hypothetical protein
LKGILALSHFAAVPFLAVFVVLIFIGGLTMACFTKVFGIAFLGQPRSESASQAHEVSWSMRVPQIVLSLGCWGVALAVPFGFARIMSPVLESVSGLSPGLVESTLWETSGILGTVVGTGLGVAVLVAIVIALRQWLLRGRPVGQAVTWDCGYSQPTPRMQYTESSFSQPLTSLFRLLVPVEQVVVPPAGLFPNKASFSIRFLDLFMSGVYIPLFTASRKVIFRFRWLQHGRLQIYILYIALTLLVLLLWKL